MAAKIMALVGGIAKDSVNRKLLEFVKARAKGRFVFDAPEIKDLPFFSQDLEDDPPAVVKDYRARFAAADAYLFLTPEYNRGIPGVLKNALDWTSRPQFLGNDKPAAVMGASGGPMGTFGAQQHLRNILSFLNFRVMGQPEFYFHFSRYVDEQGHLDPKSGEFIEQFLDAYAAWIAR